MKICPSDREERAKQDQPSLVWLLIDAKDMENTLPEEGQQIYLSISEGEGMPFTDTFRATADRAALEDLVLLHPYWRVLWQPVPSPPPAPTYSDITQFTRSVSSQKAPMSQAEGSEKGGVHGEQTS